MFEVDYSPHAATAYGTSSELSTFLRLLHSTTSRRNSQLHFEGLCREPLTRRHRSISILTSQRVAQLLYVCTLDVRMLALKLHTQQ